MKRAGPNTFSRPPLGVRLLSMLMSLVFSGVGVLAVVAEYSPAASTRFGIAGPFFDGDAIHLGVTMAIVGLAPLALCARTAKGAGWFASSCMIFGLGYFFWGLRAL